MPRQKSTHVDSASAVGRRLREARERAGLSQRQLAFAGCTSAYISRIEAGDRIPSLQTLRELGKRLGVDADFLATGDGGKVSQSDPLLEAELALRFDDLVLAGELYESALTAAGNDHERAGALAGLGQLAYRDGDPRRARDYLEEALRLWGDNTVERSAAAADTLGRAYSVLGELESAIGLFERWLADAEARDDLLEVLRFSVFLANALIDSGNGRRAEELLGQTLARSEGIGDPLVQARLYWSQSRLHTFEERPELASRYARKALEIVELNENTAYVARAEQLLAHVVLERGEPEEALERTRRALDLLGTGNPLERAKFRIEEARALAQLGEREEAAAIALESAGALRERYPIEAARNYSVVAESVEALGDRARARELYELAAEAHEGLQSRYLVHIYGRLAQVLEDDGRKDEALEVLKKAMRVQTHAAQRRDHS